ncbi:unnamed protein product [Cuscuta europaea]|uniref:GAG-pre-integrase domain-containing protein n=1 Tax=Cuscuta europaea TaxID=41803 RepID=A0A9P0ZC53_CUSEU|nr:unnamed protein product [Cuscuta europaea]
MDTLASERVALQVSSKFEVWHQRLGHASNEKLSHIDILQSFKKDIPFCDSCVRAKQTRIKSHTGDGYFFYHPKTILLCRVFAMPIGPAAHSLADHVWDILLHWAAPLFLGGSRSKVWALVPQQKQNIDPWSLRSAKSFGYVGYYVILIFTFPPRHPYSATIRTLVTLLQTLFITSAPNTWK